MTLKSPLRGLLPLLLLLLASGVSRADTTVGSFQSSSTNPFLYNEAPSQSIDYQQVYTSSAFTGTTDINSLTFYFDNAADRALSQISGTYTVMWGYAAPGSVNGLTTNLAGNFMAPPGILGTFTIPVRRPANNNDNNNVAFTLSGFNFDYNPAKGNLLMEIVINNQQVILNGANRASQGLEADPSGSVTSRAFCMTGMGCSADATGLVTTFGTSPIATPEPSTLVMLGSGILGLASVFRRHIV